MTTFYGKLWHSNQSQDDLTAETPNLVNSVYTSWASHNMLSVGWLFLREVEVPRIKIINSDNKYHTAKCIPCWVVCNDITVRETIEFLKLKPLTVIILSLKLFCTISKIQFVLQKIPCITITKSDSIFWEYVILQCYDNCKIYDISQISIFFNAVHFFKLYTFTIKGGLIYRNL